MSYQRASQITEKDFGQNKLPSVEEENKVQQPTAVSTATAVSSNPLLPPNDLHQLTNGRLSHAGNTLLQLQNQFGNRYVQQLINPQQQLTVQPKLLLGDVDTPSEREADRIASQATGSGQVTSMPTSVHGPTLPVSPETERTINQARGGGQSLPESTRTHMEHSLGTDLSGVRVHTDSRADSLNQSLQAKAFTTGQDIFFRRNEYNPGSSAGQNLLAHELVHTAQQNGSTIQRKIGFEIETRIPLRGKKGAPHAAKKSGNGYITSGVGKPIRLDKDQISSKKGRHPIIELVSEAYDETAKSEYTMLGRDIETVAGRVKDIIKELRAHKDDSDRSFTAHTMEFSALGATDHPDLKLGAYYPIKEDVIDDTGYIQATAGIRLERVPQALDKVMEMRNPDKDTDAVDVLDNIVKIRKRMIDTWKDIHNDSPNRRVVGYFNVLAQLLGGHAFGSGLDKNSQLLLPKTSFKAMYDLLTITEKSNMAQSKLQRKIKRRVAKTLENLYKKPIKLTEHFWGSKKKPTLSEIIDDFIGKDGKSPTLTIEPQKLFGETSLIDPSKSVTTMGRKEIKVPAFEFRRISPKGTRESTDKWKETVLRVADTVRKINLTKIDEKR